MKRRLVLRGFLILLVGGIACRQTSLKEVDVDFDARTGTSLSTASTKKLNVALAAMISPKATAKEYAKLINELGQLLEQNVNLTYGRSYAQVNESLIAGKLHFAFLCTGGYLELRQRAPHVSVLVVPRVQGKVTYRSLVIVQKKTTYKTFKDLKGKRFAFTDPLSNTGYFYPISLIKSLNSDKDAFFASYVFTGSHDRAILAVQRGIQEAAAVDSLVYEYLERHRPKAVNGLRVLQRSEEFGIPPIVAAPSASEAQKIRWRHALLHLHERADARRSLQLLDIERFVLPPQGLFHSAEELFQRTR